MICHVSGRDWSRTCRIDIHTDRARASARDSRRPSHRHIAQPPEKLHLLHSHRLGNITLRISVPIHILGMLWSGMQKQVAGSYDFLNSDSQ